jgi:AraC-like DNA-binding protein
VIRAWRRLRDTRGQLRIHDLARELAVSRSYLTKRSEEQIGPSQKTVARIQRFRHVGVA